MAQQREATTDRLVGIIATIKMERQSGQLRVRRGEGLTTEEGILIFARGQVTRASVGRRSGPDALNWLSTWGQAHYTFLPVTSDEGIALTFPLPLSSPGKTAINPDLLVARVNTDKLHTDSLELAHASACEAPHPCMELSEAMAHIERAGLARAHRRLYLLIDGRRSVYELAPLAGKSVEEVRSMLHDLEWLGIIQIANPQSEP